MDGNQGGVKKTTLPTDKNKIEANLQKCNDGEDTKEMHTLRQQFKELSISESPGTTDTEPSDSDPALDQNDSKTTPADEEAEPKPPKPFKNPFKF